MKKSLFFVSVLAAAMLTSCGKPVAPEQVTVNPSPLTVVGDKVNADITGTFPVKKFSKKAIVTITPVLKYEGGETLGAPVTYVGEKAKENGKTVSSSRALVTNRLLRLTTYPLWLSRSCTCALRQRTATKRWLFLI